MRIQLVLRDMARRWHHEVKVGALFSATGPMPCNAACRLLRYSKMTRPQLATTHSVIVIYAITRCNLSLMAFPGSTGIR